MEGGRTTLCAIFVSVVLAAALPWVRGEMFTAVVHMEGLIGLERELLKGLNSYIVAEKRRLQTLEEFSDHIQQALDLVDDTDPREHLFDPVNAFQLINRYINGWMKMHDSIYMDQGQDLMANISLNRYRFPAEEDLDGAMTAIRRLQDTYELQPLEIASGKLKRSGGLPMTAQDCYTLGQQAYQSKHWLHTRQWMLEALNRFDSEDSSDLDLPSVYDHLSFSEYQLGNVKRAAQYTKELLQNDPTHERALSNLRFFEDVQLNSPEQYVDVDDEEGEGERELSEHEKYEALCREAAPIPAKDHHKLICFYFTNGNNPRLILRPAKMEIVFPQPRLYMWRDAISEIEMERVIELGEPKLRRATARNAATGQYETVDYRISKSGWLSPEDDSMGIVGRVDQRIEDVTGLTMETAEQLQVVNYGLGGHYEPHFDFARGEEDAFSSLGTGNRVATVLFYMSPVERGGATVFPQVGARLPPSYGDAAFWWNLKKSGRGDLLTRHAGCPVLVGSKWVCNKWIHERGQEFRRPCGLSPDE